MKVRHATTKDIANVVNASVQFAAGAYPDDDVDEVYFSTVIEVAITRDDAVVAILEGPKGDFGGVFYAALGPNPLNGSLICAEAIVWTADRYRGHGPKLLRFVEDWARKKGCKTAILSRPYRQDRPGKVFEAWGYAPAEVWYRKALT